MNLPALRLLLLALSLAGCSQTEQQVPEFRTVTIDLREPDLRLTAGEANVPPPERKPIYAAAIPNATVPEPEVASSRVSRWIPDFGKLTDCPNGVLCNAFTN